MIPSYFIVDREHHTIPATIRPAKKLDYDQTVFAHWQTNWHSEYIQQGILEKYALEIEETQELVGMGAYRDVPDGVMVLVEYIESAPSCNPTLQAHPRFSGIGAALLAFGIQLSIDKQYGGTIFLKAKTSELRRHYIEDFGAIPFSRSNPFLLLIDGESAWNLFSQYLKEEPT